MSLLPHPRRFWINGLQAVAAAVAAFGLVLVVLPAFAREDAFVLVYASPGRIDEFGAAPVRCISLPHAVLGGVMVG